MIFERRLFSLTQKNGHHGHLVVKKSTTKKCVPFRHLISVSLKQTFHALQSATISAVHFYCTQRCQCLFKIPTCDWRHILTHDMFKISLKMTDRGLTDFTRNLSGVTVVWEMRRQVLTLSGVSWESVGDSLTGRAAVTLTTPLVSRHHVTSRTHAVNTELV